MSELDALKQLVMSANLTTYEPWLSERIKADGPKVECPATCCQGEFPDISCLTCNGTGSVPRYDSVESWLRDSPYNEGGRHHDKIKKQCPGDHNDKGERYHPGFSDYWALCSECSGKGWFYAYKPILTATQLLSLVEECLGIYWGRTYHGGSFFADKFDGEPLITAPTADTLAPLVLRAMGAPDAAHDD